MLSHWRIRYFILFVNTKRVIQKQLFSNQYQISLGYIALHVIDLLLKEGHKVRTTVRSLENEEKCGPIKALAKNPEQLTLVEADLHNAECWKETVKNIDIVFHVASPFPLMPAADTHEELIKTAVDGTNNVLKVIIYK